MNAQTYFDLVMPGAERFFPPEFSSKPSRAMVLAWVLQESDLRHRQQLIGGFRDWWKSERGPAAGYCQFERIGIRGVLEHKASADRARFVLALLGYPDDVETIFRALIHNDLLGAAFVRLALWRLPQPLPTGLDEVEKAWAQYLLAAAPGKPKKDKWYRNYKTAWDIVNAAD